MPMRPALVAMIRIVKARIPTQIFDQKARVAPICGTTPKPVTMPTTGSALYSVPRRVV